MPASTPASRRLSAILAADVAGYSRLIGADERGTLDALKHCRQAIVDPAIAAHGGRIVKTTGDGLLAEFASAVRAVECAIEIQARMDEAMRDTAEDRRLAWRIGINVGDIADEGGDIFGEGVNIAARLEGIAAPGGICITERVHEDLQGKLALGFEDRGDVALKNIARPVRVFAVQPRVAPGTAAPAVPPASGKPSIAVLPLDNMSGDPDQEYFADGIAEEIITALSKLRGFFVVARNSSFSYKGRAVEARRIARELGVQYLLEGSVRKAGNRVRITAQLIDAVADKHLWSEKFDRELTDIFAIQDEIARAVASAAEPQLYQAESLRSRETPTKELRAWDYTIRALPAMWRFTGHDTAIAEKLLDVAVTYDPDYAFAHSLRALVLAMRVHMGWEPDTAPALAKANESADRAASLDPEDAWSHLAVGYCRLLARETADAIAEMEAAIRLNPSSAMAHMALAIANNHAGRSAEGRRTIEEAMRISPRDPMMSYFSAIRSTAEFIDKNYPEALAWARKAVRESHDNPSALRSIVISNAMLGNLDEARAALARLKAIQPAISMHYVEKVQPFTEPDMRARYIEGFRRAGLT